MRRTQMSCRRILKLSHLFFLSPREFMDEARFILPMLIDIQAVRESVLALGSHVSARVWSVLCAPIRLLIRSDETVLVTRDMRLLLLFPAAERIYSLTGHL